MYLCFEHFKIYAEKNPKNKSQFFLRKFLPPRFSIQKSNPIRTNGRADSLVSDVGSADVGCYIFFWHRPLVIDETEVCL